MSHQPGPIVAKHTVHSSRATFTQEVMIAHCSPSICRLCDGLSQRGERDGGRRHFEWAKNAIRTTDYCEPFPPLRASAKSNETTHTFEAEIGILVLGGDTTFAFVCIIA